MSIYLKLPKGKKFANIRQLLIYGYKGTFNAHKITKGFVKTYHDKACTSEQCHNNANRSFEDLMVICKTYFPKTTDVKLAKCLYGLHKTHQMAIYYCGGVNKLVFYRRSDAPAFNTYIYERFGELTKRGVGTYNYTEFMELVNN